MTTKRLVLDQLNSYQSLIAAIRYLPFALSEIGKKNVFPNFTYHISDRFGTTFGLSNGDVCYPINESENFEELKKLIVNLEDKRFFNHSGVDTIGILRAIYKNFAGRRFAQGGSTITQQLVRNIFLTPRKSLTRKIVEVFLAYKIERVYTKSEILKAYCSYVYLGHGVRGFEAASKTIYRKPLKALNGYELVGVLGLLGAPNRYHPLSQMESFHNRQTVIASRFNIKPQAYSINPISVSNLQSARFSGIISNVLKNLDVEINEVSKVEITVDMRLQTIVDKALRDAAQDDNILDVAAVVLDNESGDVLAESSWHQGKMSEFSPAYFGNIQPGSTFKTFTFLAALEQGFHPEIKFQSMPFVSTIFKQSDKTLWQVRNFAQVYRGEISLLDALIWSDNTVFANLTQVLNQHEQYDIYRKFGLLENNRPTPSLCLGSLSSGINLISLANAYRTIARNGVISEVRFCKAIINRDKTVEVLKPASSRAIANYADIKQVKNALRLVARASGVKGFSGKTGTTSSGSVFSGYNEDVSLAIWVRYKHSPSEYIHKGHTAVSIFNKFSDALLGHHHGRLLEII